jgi:malonyl-CoA decarboxylase
MNGSSLGRRLRGVPNRLGDLVARIRQGTRRYDIHELAERLLSVRGEVSGVSAATELLVAYQGLPEADKLAFLLHLERQFGPERTRLERALSKFAGDPTEGAAQEMHEAAEPRRQELFRRINLAPGGTNALLAMREDVLRNLADHPELAAVDGDFRHLFSSWFNRGFLVLRRIDWSSPASLLEKIIRYEAVHEIAGWDDLRRRVAPSDRRCFAFFHPTLSEDPLIFLEVALTRGIPDAIGPLLAKERVSIPAGEATTAVFYSISNCQAGLKGVPLGHFLIKQVVEELKRELPSLKVFITLSPVLGFMRWLEKERNAADSKHLTDADRAALALLDRPNWHLETETVKALKSVLMPAAAGYLLLARTASGKPVEPVARFHLGNGARLERIHWMSDVSPKGLAQGAGIMANYLYELERIEENRQIFTASGEMPASHAVRKLLRSEARRIPVLQT